MILSGRVAVVTGAGRGIGAAIARAFATEGARLVLGDLDRAAAASMAAEFPGAVGVRADVGDPADAESLVAAAEHAFGRVDILVNNAGLGVNKPFMDTTPDDIARVMRVNLTGAMLCSQAALRRMLPARYGRIVNITSVSGQRGNFGRTAYGASKAALELMTKVMVAELGDSGVTVNAVAPGPVETEMAAAIHDAETRRLFNAHTPVGRYGQPAEIAAACVFLASKAAAYVSGQVVNVDGGFAAAGLMR